MFILLMARPIKPRTQGRLRRKRAVRAAVVAGAGALLLHGIGERQQRQAGSLKQPAEIIEPAERAQEWRTSPKTIGIPSIVPPYEEQIRGAMAATGPNTYSGDMEFCSVDVYKRRFGVPDVAKIHGFCRDHQISPLRFFLAAELIALSDAPNQVRDRAWQNAAPYIGANRELLKTVRPFLDTHPNIRKTVRNTKSSLPTLLANLKIRNDAGYRPATTSRYKAPARDARASIQSSRPQHGARGGRGRGKR